MILTDDQIKDIIVKPSNENIELWKQDHITMETLVNGGDVALLLSKVDNYENVDQERLRKKLARSTKDLMAYLLKPAQKVFSAAGFYTEFKNTRASVQDQVMEYFAKLPEGISLRKWMQDYWMEAYVTDPNAVVLVERNEKGDAYPAYKSISVIHDYLYKMGKFEYLVLFFGKRMVSEPQGREKMVDVYRVIDNVRDALYYLGNEGELKVYNNPPDEPHDLGNPLGEVPAVVVSDITDKKTGGKRSFLHRISELLLEYLRDSSVHTIYKFLHGFPLFWAYAMDCTTCHGEGMVDNPRYIQGGNEPLRITCPTCKGKRLQVTRDVSDGVRLPLPQSGDDPVVAPNIAGYIQPDLETWKQQRETMNEMKRDMHFATWGSHVEDEKSNTATGRFIDKQPVDDTLRTISDSAEKKETEIARWITRMSVAKWGRVGDIVITYGKRFMIETPDILWENYIEAREKNAPVSALDDLYVKYLNGEYFGDSQLLDQKLKEFYLEPFPHHTLSDLHGSASPSQLQRKLLYSDWVNGEVDFSKTTEELRAEFDAFVRENEDVPALMPGAASAQEPEPGTDNQNQVL